MFSRVAGRYDLLNHLLSLNIDRYWRVRTVRRLRGILHRPGARVLDICCGTGDLLLALESERGAAVMGSDFCHPMLVAAGRKMARRKSPIGSRSTPPPTTTLCAFRTRISAQLGWLSSSTPCGREVRDGSSSLDQSGLRAARREDC
jgi:SAM-dependent methyltransferase